MKDVLIKANIIKLLKFFIIIQESHNKMDMLHIVRYSYKYRTHKEEVLS